MRALKTVAVAGLVIAAGQAQASFSRVATFGSQPAFQPPTTMVGRTGLNLLAVPGSLWYEDDYNVFLNPALIHYHRNFATVSASRTAFIQGGAFAGYDTLMFGAYVNRLEDPYVMQPGAAFRGFRNVGGRSADFGPGVPVEIFAGVDLGVKVGAKLTWQHREQERRGGDISTNYWDLTLGAELLSFELFSMMSLDADYTDEQPGGPTQSLDRFQIGARYTWEATWRPYILYTQQREDISSNRFATSVGAKSKAVGFGLGHDTELFDRKVKIFKHVGFWRADLNDTTDGVYDHSQWTHTVVPLNVAAEWLALDWLTLRAGLSYDAFNTATRREGTLQTNRSTSFSLRDGVRPRIGAAVNLMNFTSELAVGQGVNDNAINAAALRPEKQAFGFNPEWFMAVTLSYSAI